MRFFELYIAIVVDVKILIIVVKRAGIAIVVAIIISGFVGIIVDFASNINRHSNIIITIALSILDFVYFDIFYNLSNFGKIGDYNIVDKYI